MTAWRAQRMQQLQASMDDASNRLAPAEAARAKWISPADLSQQQVQQQMDQLKVGVYCTARRLPASASLPRERLAFNDVFFMCVRAPRRN